MDPIGKRLVQARAGAAQVDAQADAQVDAQAWAGGVVVLVRGAGVGPLACVLQLSTRLRPAFHPPSTHLPRCHNRATM